MPFRAMRFFCVQGSWTTTAEHILALSHNFQMGRVNTGTIATEMING